MEKKKTDVKFIVALTLNLSLVIMETYSLISYYLSDGLVMFRMFTEDSNIILFLSSLIFTIFGIKKLAKGRDLPRFVGVIRYVATCVIMVTLTVVSIQVFFISKLQDFKMFYNYEMIFHHTICPLVCLVSFFGFEKTDKLKIKDTLFAILPTLVYAIVLILLNILNITVGPYFFLEVYSQSVLSSIMWFFIVLGSSYVVCLLFMFLSNLKHKSH